MNDLADKRCVPCHSNTPILKDAELKKLHEKLGDGWKIRSDRHLEKEFAFKNFAEALSFTNNVGAIAEEQGHHPDIYLSWGKVRIILFTHKSGGLTENDFIMAAKINSISIGENKS